MHSWIALNCHLSLTGCWICGLPSQGPGRPGPHVTIGSGPSLGIFVHCGVPMVVEDWKTRVTGQWDGGQWWIGGWKWWIGGNWWSSSYVSTLPWLGERAVSNPPTCSQFNEISLSKNK